MPDDRTPIYAFIINPVAREGLRGEVERLASERSLEARWYETTEDDPGAGQTKAAIHDGAHIVVACGGDGTVRSCLEGAAGRDTPVGIIPAGTGNLLALNLDIPTDANGAADALVAGSTTTIDVGTVNGEAFAIMAGLGLDAEIMHDTDREAKDTWGTAAYLATAIRHLGDDPFQCSVTDGSVPVYQGPATAVLIGNHGRLQGGFELFPDANHADGRLDLLVATGTGLADWIASAAAVVTDDVARGPVERFVAERFRIEVDRPTPYELDGEARTATRSIDVALHDATVDIITPPREDMTR